MNAHSDPEQRLLDAAAAAPAGAPEATAGATAGAALQRHVWHGRFGPMVIEVRERGVYVNGAYVEPAPPTGRQPD